jgi:tRNA threonylcarbamoyladenosine biosynthesis protein TsaB
MAGLLLAVDTSTKMASVALYDGVQVRAELTWEAPRRHTTELAPRVVELLEELRVKPSALTGLAVALGPGSFTGLRIGLALAKGLALAQSVPLVGIPTLDVTAHGVGQQRATLYAALQAGRGRICVAPYRWRHDQWQRIGDIALTTWPELVPELDKGAVVSGELDKESLKILGQQAGRVTIASPAQRLRRAGHLAELGWKRLAQGERDDPAVLQPIYLQTV